MKEYKNKVKNTLVNYKTNFIFNTLAFSSKLWKIIFSTLLLLPFLGTSQTITISSFPGKGNLKLTPEQEKIHELEKKLKDAELERDILKKAIGIFYS